MENVLEPSNYGALASTIYLRVAAEVSFYLFVYAGYLVSTYRISKFFRLAKTPSGRYVTAFKDKYLKGFKQNPIHYILHFLKRHCSL